MKKLLLVLSLVLSFSVFASTRAGRGVSIGAKPPPPRAAAAPRPAPAPRYAAPATPRYAAPAPRYAAPATPRYAAPATPAPVIVNQGGGSGGGGFWSSFGGAATGAVVGNYLTRPAAPAPAAAPAYSPAQGYVPAYSPPPTPMEGRSVQQADAPVAYTPQPQVVTVTAAPSGPSYGWWLFWLVFLLVVGGAIAWYMNRQRKITDSQPAVNTDPIHQFYTIQQAALNGDIVVLDRYCTLGMAMMLSHNPDPTRHALGTMVGLTYEKQPDNVVQYTFKDTVDKKIVTERWVYDKNKLAGIEVKGEIAY